MTRDISDRQKEKRINGAVVVAARGRGGGGGDPSRGGGAANDDGCRNGRRRSEMLRAPSTAALCVAQLAGALISPNDECIILLTDSMFNAAGSSHYFQVILRSIVPDGRTQ